MSVAATTIQNKHPRLIPIVLIVLRLLLGAVFVFSAVAKVVGIDHFELYIYSYGAISLNLTYIVARVVISIEFTLGILLLTGWLPQVTLLVSLGLTLFFSIFLCIAILLGRTDSCQCFGQVANMPPAQSLVKNGVLAVAIVAAIHLTKKGQTSTKRNGRRHVWWSATVAVATTICLFTVSVPDNWLYKASNQQRDYTALQVAMQQCESLQQVDYAQGNHLIAFLTPGCNFCKMTKEKLTYIEQRQHLDSRNIHLIYPQDIGVADFMNITHGQRPLVVLTTDGCVVGTYHYRNLREKELAHFLPHIDSSKTRW
ncbi:MAG: DoxX family membrane protein [Bacteroidales bacterium]|nr:DoxX family membrane protein [Bacteroidales bacterium]